MPKYKRLAAAEASDETFVRRLERRLPDGASVFQMPYVPFFEADLGDSDQYEMLRPYLQSHDLRWSFGAMHGRPRDWYAAMATLPPSYVLPAAAAAGFSGVVVHRVPFGPIGIDAEAQICRMLDQRPLSSPNGELAFYDLRRYREALRRTHGAAAVATLGAVTTRPVVMRYRDGFNPAEQEGMSRWAWTKKRRARITLHNPEDTTRGVRFSGSVGAGPGAEADARVTWPDGAVQQVHIPPDRAVGFFRDVNAKPGDNVIVLESLSRPTPALEGDKRKLFLRVNDAVAVDTALLGFVQPVPEFGRFC